MNADMTISECCAVHLFASMPIERSALLVGNGENTDVVGFDGEHDAVGKLPDEFPADIVENDREVVDALEFQRPFN